MNTDAERSAGGQESKPALWKRHSFVRTHDLVVHDACAASENILTGYL